jgi:hypothetical protein
VTGVAPGYYDNGRWVAGRTTGRYDASGRWMPGRPDGYRDANGVWVAAPAAGYYDRDGRWRAGQSQGYYDARGVWISTGTSAAYATPNKYASPNGAYDDRNQPRDIGSRYQRISSRIDQFANDGTMNRDQVYRARADLDSIRRSERSMRHYNGRLSPRGEQMIQARLDAMSQRLRDTRQEARTGDYGN